MNAIKDAASAAVRRTPRRAVRAVVLLASLLGAVGGCQRGAGRFSGNARFAFDSLVAANEALYDSATTTNAYDRIGCLYLRAYGRLGDADSYQVLKAANHQIIDRHSRTEQEEVNQRLHGEHPMASTEDCVGVDSIWYAHINARTSGHPKP